MSIDRLTKRVFVLVLLAAGLVAVSAVGGYSVAAGASGQPPRSIAVEQGNPSAVPPILRPATASELAAIKRAEAQREAARSYSAPAGARYSSADTDAYAAVARPVAASGPVVKAPGAGFDYGAAALGAGFTVGIVVLIAAGGIAVRRRRQPQYG
jgi:hypothetical protein